MRAVGLAVLAGVCAATFDDGATSKPGAYLQACDDKHPLGQWVYPYPQGDFIYMKFMNKTYDRLNTCLGVRSAKAGTDDDGAASATSASSSAALRGTVLPARPAYAIGVVACDAPGALWSSKAVWSGGGSTYSPSLDSTLCMTTSTKAGSGITLQACKSMPPPQPNGYKGLTQTWYYGPGGVGGDFSLVESRPNGGGTTSPAYCVTVVGNITSTSTAYAAAAAGSIDNSSH